MRIAAVVAGVALLSLSAPAHAKEEAPNHGGAAIGGAVAGLICGGGTLVYAKARERVSGTKAPFEPGVTEPTAAGCR